MVDMDNNIGNNYFFYDDDLVSIIVPLFNAEKYIKHTIKSVLNQTYSQWEMIIVDDASTDESLKIVQDYASKDSRIKLIKSPTNNGVSISRNIALKEAKGRYIAFLDSDDLWSKFKLEKQIDFLRKNDYALSHTSYAFVNNNGNIRHKGYVEVDDNVDLIKYMKTTQIGLSSVMIDRSKIDNIEFVPNRELCEDAKLWMSYLRNGMTFHGLNEVLTLYRIRPDQTSRNKFYMALNTLKRYWKEKNFPHYKRLFYFLNYAYHGVEKRKRTVDKDIKLDVNEFKARER